MTGALGLLLASVLLLATGILWLVRRDLLDTRAAAWWLLLEVVVVLVLLFHGVLSGISTALGFSHPVFWGLLLLAVVVLLRILRGDIAHTRTQKQLVILAQRVALLEEKLRR